MKEDFGCLFLLLFVTIVGCTFWLMLEMDWHTDTVVRTIKAEAALEHTKVVAVQEPDKPDPWELPKVGGDWSRFNLARHKGAKQDLRLSLVNRGVAR